MLNYIWLCLMVAAVLIGGWNNHLDEVIKGAFDMARAAVMDIALPLSAIMTVWLGVMRLADNPDWSSCWRERCARFCGCSFLTFRPIIRPWAPWS